MYVVENLSVDGVNEMTFEGNFSVPKLAPRITFFGNPLLSLSLRSIQHLIAYCLPLIKLTYIYFLYTSLIV